MKTNKLHTENNLSRAEMRDITAGYIYPCDPCGGGGGGGTDGSCDLYCCDNFGNCSVYYQDTQYDCTSNEDCQSWGNQQGYTCPDGYYLAGSC